MDRNAGKDAGAQTPRTQEATDWTASLATIREGAAHAVSEARMARRVFAEAEARRARPAPSWLGRLIERWWRSRG